MDFYQALTANVLQKAGSISFDIAASIASMAGIVF